MTKISRLAHARALLIPLSALLFYVLHPSSAWVALAFAISPFFPSFPGDGERLGLPPAKPSRLWFSFLIVGGAVLQLVNLPLAARMVAVEGWTSGHAIAAIVLTIVSSSLCGAILGHELIHRPHPGPVAIGRLLLASVLYEHFHTEHLRGHHAHYATEEDPATARFGETFWAYLKRNPGAQFKNAWRLDRTRVLQGLALEAAITVAFFLAFGVSGLAFFLLQAAIVHVVVNAVQYFEHWGLARDAGYPSSWDAEDRASLFGMIGLARHADHHARPSKPFEALEPVAESPKLPYPYGTMIFLAVAANRRFQRLMTQELARLGHPG